MNLHDAFAPHNGKIRSAAGGPMVERRSGHRMTQVAPRASPRPSTSYPNPLFDAQWYLTQYPDVRESSFDPYDHFMRHGASEGRNPNAFFDTSWYLANNPDVRASVMNPLDHYLRHGAAEGRKPGPTIDPIDQAIT